jgi:Zn-dependent protease
MSFDLIYIIVVIVVVLTSMVLHELMHGLVAYWLGDTTAKENGRLSLNPFKHLDWFMSFLLPLLLAISGGPIFGGAKPVPIDGRRLKGGEWGFALVAVAGPLTNLVLAFIAYVIYATVNPAAGTIWFMILVQFIMVNLGFAVFNMIPIPPLDGSRILYAIAPEVVQKFMMRIEQFGIVLVLALVMLFGGVFGQIMTGAMQGILTFFQWLVP